MVSSSVIDRLNHISYLLSISQNIVSAVFLLYMSEEEAFWLLCTVAEDIVPEYYNKTLLGSTVDQYIFNSLVQNNLKEVYEHLNDKVTEIG